jgi:transposase
MKKKLSPFVEQGGHRFFWFDETWIKTNMTPNRGWCDVSERLIEYVPHGHWKTLTCVGMLSSSGLEGVRVFDRPMNGVLFSQYVDDVMLNILKPGDVVIMDNLSCHHNAGVRRKIRKTGAKIWFVPPYSPDENPIENVFSVLKNALRKAAERTIEALTEAVQTIAKNIAPEKCQNMILNAGYPIPLGNKTPDPT